MNICEYCKKKGMNLQEYKTFKNNMVEIAKAIRCQLTYKNGIYYNTSELFKYGTDENIKNFIIQELKKLDIEFIDNNTLYRVCS